MKQSGKIKTEENHGKTLRSVSYDFQSILTLPFAGESAIYYKIKLNAYNFTIYENHSRDGYCYISSPWDNRVLSNIYAEDVFFYCVKK